MEIEIGEIVIDDEVEIGEITVNNEIELENIELDITIEKVIDVEHYKGEYNIIPQAYEQQELETKNKVMKKNYKSSFFFNFN